KFCQAQFGVAPEGLNAVDMTTVSGKFIVVMVDAMVLIAFHHQSVVGAPAVGVDRALAGKHLTAEITSINSAFEQFMTGEQKTFPLLLKKPMKATFGPIHGLGVRALGAVRSSSHPLDASRKRSGFALKYLFLSGFQLLIQPVAI